MEQVYHPTHYNSDPSGVECIEIVKHRDFCVGNAIKYLWRAGLKVAPEENAIDAEIRDLEKARYYINEKIAMLEAKREETERKSEVELPSKSV